MKLRLQIRPRIIITVVIMCFIVWFVTAPACMSIQRIAAGSGRGPIAVAIIKMADIYQAPMFCFSKIPFLGKINSFLEDWWSRILDAPETTP